MNTITLTIAFSSKQEYIFEAKKLPKSVIDYYDFDLNNYKSLEDLNKDIEVKRQEAALKVNDIVYTNYIDISPYPNPKGFYPTGGVRWSENAWQFQQYLKNPPTDNLFKIGDRVRFLNGYGLPLESNIFGFNSEGNAILNWDCYWVSKNLESLEIVN